MSVLLVGGTLWGTEGPADLLLEDRRIAAIGARAPEGAEVIDVTGMLLLPGLVEAHCHLDKTLYGGRWVSHTAGDALADRIAHDLDRRAGLGVPDVDRITALLGRMCDFGTTIVRSHTDVDPIVGLRGIEAVTEAAGRLADRVDVQQVAFPSSPTRAPSSSSTRLSPAGSR
jgi:cytosine deaminase